MEDLLYWLTIICFLVIAYYIVYRWLPRKGFFKIEGEEKIKKYKKREINFKSFMYGLIALLLANFIQGFIFRIEGKWFPIGVALITAFIVKQKLSDK
jgi:Na+/H+ antiporter NhaD/arsenite permease-like protein